MSCGVEIVVITNAWAQTDLAFAVTLHKTYHCSFRLNDTTDNDSTGNWSRRGDDKITLLSTSRKLLMIKPPKRQELNLPNSTLQLQHIDQAAMLVCFL